MNNNPLKRPPIEQLVNEITVWNKRDNGVYKGLYLDSADNFALVPITPEELCQVDPRLPEVLDHQMRVQTTMGADKMQVILEYWRDTPLVINRKKAAIAVYNLASVRPTTSHGARLVTLKGRQYLVEYTETGIDYARCTIPLAAKVQRELFDAQFPGWKNRYDIGSAIGLSQKELVSCVVDYSDDLPMSLEVPEMDFGPAV